MNGPLVSIIVPVYNAAAGLAKCIETARRQTYGNIELLLVNDGSADSSPHICPGGFAHPRNRQGERRRFSRAQ